MSTPSICAVITSPDLAQIHKAALLADLFELRIDLLGKSWESVAKAMRKPWIATNRMKTEGGAWEGSEETRRDELLKAIKLGATIVDVEMSSPCLDEIVPQIKKGAKCLISHHDFTHTPPHHELCSIVDNELSCGADICKVITTAHSTADNLNVLELIKDYGQIQITSFAMGWQGQLSRILSPLCGACFTYAALDESSTSAAGQLSLTQMRRIYELL